MSTLEEIGGVLGFVAFAGVAVLIFLTFQQARHVRRLREWAGRAPERAVVAAEREQEIAAGGTAIRAEEPEEPTGPSRVDLAKESLKRRYAELDRRLPVDPRILLGGIAAVLLGVGIATSGFGLVGGEQATIGAGNDGGDKQNGPAPEKPAEPIVAVLNASGSVPGQPGTPGLANKIGASVVEAGYELGKVTNADSLPISVVMFTSDGEDAAADLAADLEPVLGTTETAEMIDEVASLVGQADLAVVIGVDDAGV